MLNVCMGENVPKAREASGAQFYGEAGQNGRCVLVLSHIDGTRACEIVGMEVSRFK